MRVSRRAAWVCTLVCFIALSGCHFAYPAVEGKFERVLNVSGRVDLDVNTGSGRIDVRTGDASTVRISGIIQARDDRRSSAQEKVRYLEDNPPIEQDGNVIRIGRIEDEAYRNNVSISYEISVPADTRLRSKTGSGGQKIEGVRGPVDAGTGSGSISMYDIGDDATATTGSGSIQLDQIAGRVQMKTGSGSIRAEHIAGSIQASTGSGGITLDQTAPEQGGIVDVEATTGSGSIRIRGVNGMLRAVSGSGSITASGNPSGDWKVQASSGSVTLHVGADAAFDLYAHAGSGSIQVDHPITMTGIINKREVRGTVRGGGNLVDVRTGSGTITIR
jgi:hypothetical protein